MSALYAAARTGDARGVREYFSRPRVHTSGLEKDAATAMLAACRYGHVEVMRVFLQEGVDLHTLDKERKGLLCSAALAPNCVEIAQLLLDHGPLNLNGSSTWSASCDRPLGFACAQRRHLLVELLLRLPGLDVNAPCDRRKYTALMISCELRDTTLVSALLSHPATDVNLYSEKGETALTIAARWNAPNVVRLLLGVSGIDVNARDLSSSYSALHWACHQNHIEVAQVLLADSRTNSFLEYVIGQDGVCLAKTRGYMDIAELLLNHQKNQKKKPKPRNADRPPSKYRADRNGHF